MSPVFRIPTPGAAGERGEPGAPRTDPLVPAASTLGRRAMVASPHHLASQTGAYVMRAGGSAIDAAIATNLMLSVVYPDMCGVGGDLIAVIWEPGGQHAVALDASGTGGSGHERSAFARRFGSPELYGPTSITIPGAPRGWLALHERYGKLSLQEVVQPAVEAARHGVACPVRLISSMQRWAPELSVVEFEHQPAIARTRMRMPNYANTLELLACGDIERFWSEIGPSLEMATTGLITNDDLRAYEVRWSTAIAKDVFGKRWWTAPPPSQGYIALLSAAILELSEVEVDIASPRFWHFVAESIKAAAHDRDLVLGDDPSPPQAFFDERRRADLLSDSVSPFGVPNQDGDTVYLAATDETGLGISLVQSLYHPWGSKVQIDDHGLILHNRGSSFSMIPGHRNEMAPRRRPRSTLSPTVVSENGRLAALIGTMGGDVQPQIALQLFLRSMVAAQEPAESLAAWRLFFHRGLAPTIWSGEEPVLGLEGRVPEEIRRDLMARGHRVQVGDDFIELAGHAQMIIIDQQTGTLAGSADPRSGSGGVAVW